MLAPMTLKVVVTVAAVIGGYLIAVLQEVRNRYFFDKRKNSYKRITWTILGIWIVVIPIGVWAVFLQAEKAEKRAEWHFVLNGLPIERDCTIRIPSTTAVHPVSLVVRNLGDAPAQNVNVAFGFPTVVTGNVQMASGWIPQPVTVPTTSGRLVDNQGLRLYTELSVMPIPITNGFSCSPITMTRSKNQPTTLVPATLMAASGNSEQARRRCCILLIEGDGEPTVQDGLLVPGL